MLNPHSLLSSSSLSGLLVWGPVAQWKKVNVLALVASEVASWGPQVRVYQLPRAFSIILWFRVDGLRYYSMVKINTKLNEFDFYLGLMQYSIISCDN